jgi:hypothetical protein
MGTDMWRKAIEKEMRNVMVAFDVRDDGKVPIGLKEISCHLVFNIKYNTLARKARFIAGGHQTDPPKDCLLKCGVTTHFAVVLSTCCP